LFDFALETLRIVAAGSKPFDFWLFRVLIFCHGLLNAPEHFGLRHHQKQRADLICIHPTTLREKMVELACQGSGVKSSALTDCARGFSAELRVA